MYKKIVKRLIDIVLSLLLLPLLMIIIVVLGPMIYFEDKGAIIFISRRLGENQEVFNMYKFRSMKTDSKDVRNDDGSTFNSKSDPRVTRLGRFIRKTSIDEIPQLFNVLIGNMSLVGPRPDLESQKGYYNESNNVKFMVKPGITGYAQVNGRNNISWNEKLKLDEHYVRNCSFILDMKILLKTIVKVIFREGVNKNG